MIHTKFFKFFFLTSITLLSYGCVTVFPKKETDIKTLRLNLHAADFQLNHTPLQTGILVARPTTSPSLNSNRINISTAYSSSFVEDAQWSGRLPIILQELLLDAFLYSHGFHSVNKPGSGVNARYAINTEIQAFNLMLQENPNQPKIDIELVVQLIDIPKRHVVQKIILKELAFSPSRKKKDIVMTFNQATQTLLETLTRWAYQTIKEHQEKPLDAKKHL